MFSPSDLIAMLSERATSAGLWQPERCGRGAELLRQGAPSEHVLVLLGGLVKLTYLTRTGDEWVKSFIVDEGIFGVLGNEASRFGAVAIEPCTVVKLPSRWIREAVASDQRIAAGTAAFNRWLLDRKQQREEALLCDTAEARYRQMRTTEPALLKRLPQGDIARYLRVTPVAFSRIKRRVR